MTRAIALLTRESELPLVSLAASLGEITAIAVAPPGEAIEAVLADARARGAERAIRLWDDAMETTDYLGVAYALAATVRTVLGGDLTANPAVILCGDEGRGAVGPAVAERLAIPHLGEVIGAQIDDGRVVARRRSGSVVRLYAARPPLVLCASTVAGEAKAKVAQPGASMTESWGLGQAGLTGAELAYRKRFRPHPSAGPESKARVFTDVSALVERLRADGVLTGPKG
jgi:electron transfer flavoprotein beta subunit